CGLALAIAPGLAAYLPLGHRPNGLLEPGLLDAPPGTLGREHALARLKPLFESQSVLKIGHDMKGMAHLLRRYGIALKPYDCTMLMSYVLDGGQVAHTLEDITRCAYEPQWLSATEMIGTGKSLLCYPEWTSVAARVFAAERAD